MIYNFADTPKFNDVNFAYWQNGFDDAEIQNIIEYGDNLYQDKGVTGTTIESINQNLEIRNSYVSWVTLNDDTVWIYDRIGSIIRKLNAQFFNFKISGIAEQIQYTTYFGSQNQHYSWHIDKNASAEFPQRKLSAVLQLSDPSEYEGGDLEFLEGQNPTSSVKEKGIVYVFPSWLLHRVTPVTSGIRKSLVIWSSGPAFV